MTDEEWHKPDYRYVTHDKDGNQTFCECPNCGSTNLVKVGWVDERKREKLLQCRDCGTKA